MQGTISFIQSELKNIYPENEIKGFIRLILEHTCNISFTDIALQKPIPLTDKQQSVVPGIVTRLKQHEPIQYILGETEFYGLKLKVTPGVLIPRPETEELVDWVLTFPVKPDAHLLDIGTGSGCIPISIKHNLPEIKATAIDLSKQALKIARENAAIHQLDITFKERDILDWQSYGWQPFDIIISNPPYVRESEKPLMDKNILGYEPAKALFVGDSEPLVFYQAIAGFAKKYLSPSGLLFFEINEAFGKEVQALLTAKGFTRIEIKNDLSGKARMVKALK